MHMYPQANVPIVQLSVDRKLSPQQHFELGQRLGALRHRGVLILGSGNIVHNLRLVDFQNFNRKNYGFDWAIEAREFVIVASSKVTTAVVRLPPTRSCDAIGSSHPRTLLAAVVCPGSRNMIPPSINSLMTNCLPEASA